MTRLLVIQPYVPHYRAAFFDRLRSDLSSEGVDLILAAGRASGDQASRGDDVTTEKADWQLAERRARFGNVEINARHIGRLLESVKPDFIIAEQAIKNLDTWRLLLSRSRNTRTALWGHGALFSQSTNFVSEHVRRFQFHHANWFFTYTPAGAEYLKHNGYPDNRITTLFNSSDTADLQKRISQVEEQESAAFRKQYDLTDGHTGLFIGGLDRRKGIDFLLETAAEVGKVVPEFRLLIAGSGADESKVRAAQESGTPVRLLGPTEGMKKALAFANCDFVLIPEWVGLAAVDALAAGRPVITTDHPSHAPEFDYLVAQQSKIQTSHEVRAYASAIAHLTTDPDRLQRLQAFCANESKRFSIEKMSQNFTDGINRWRASPGRH